MEKSNWPKRLSKQGYSVDSTQWNRIRFQSFEQLLEDEDRFEERLRHVDSKSSTRSKQGDRTQPRSMGEHSRVPQD